MYKIIIVKADTNDADYVESNERITEAELEEIKSVIEAIKNFQPYKSKGRDWGHGNNYPTGEMCRGDLGEKSAKELYGHLAGFNLFDEKFVPGSEYGIHTIESVRVLNVESEEYFI